MICLEVLPFIGELESNWTAYLQSRSPRHWYLSTAIAVEGRRSWVDEIFKFETFNSKLNFAIKSFDLKPRSIWRCYTARLRLQSLRVCSDYTVQCLQFSDYSRYSVQLQIVTVANLRNQFANFVSLSFIRERESSLSLRDFFFAYSVFACLRLPANARPFSKRF